MESNLRMEKRTTRSFLPCKEQLYQPEVQPSVTAQVVRKRQVAKYYHDRHAKPLPNLVVGQPVRVKSHPQRPHSDWKQGVVRHNVAPRSYLVEVEGRSYRRNRVHLRDAVQPTIPAAQETRAMAAQPSTTGPATCSNHTRVEECQTVPPTEKVSVPTNVTDSVAPATTTSKVLHSRSGRTLKPNILLKDFVK